MERNKTNLKIFFWYAILWIVLFVALYLAYGVYFIDTTSTKSKWVGLFAGAVFILLSACKICEISYYKYKNSLSSEIMNYFKKGLSEFYNIAFRYMLFGIIVIGIILSRFLSYKFIICYSTGSIIGMFSLICLNFITTQSNSKIIYSIINSNKNVKKLSYDTGVTISALIIGLSISVLVVLFHIFKDYQVLNGFALGIAIIALLNSLISSISKKAVTNTNSIIKQIENDFIEYDKRNPLIQSEGITNYNLNINTSSINIVSSLIAVIIASMTVGDFCMNLMGVFFPIIVAASGIFTNILVILFTRKNSYYNPIKMLLTQGILTTVILTIISNYTISKWFPNEKSLIWSIFVGSISGLIICFCNLNCIMNKYKPVKRIARSSHNGIGEIFFQLLKESSNKVLMPIIVLALSILISFFAGYGISSPSFGIYSITLNILSFLCTTGIIIILNIYAVNLGSIKKTFNCYEKNITNIENYDFTNNFGCTISHLGKNFTYISSILSTICILISFGILAELDQIDILNPYVLVSLFMGTILPFAYCSIMIGGANKTSNKVSFEIKKQFRHFPQILTSEMRPNYEQCTRTLAHSSSLQSICAMVYVLMLFALISKLLAQEALGGFIMGIILSCIGLVILLNNSAYLISRAKKYFFEEFQNAQNTNEYGDISNIDIIANILSETIVPSLLSLINFLAILALAIIPMYM